MDKKEKKELLDPDSKVSSIRWALLQMTPVIKWMLIATPIILLIEVILPIHKIDWVGAAAYITALGVFYSGLLGMKALQKRNEL